jgi:hypothetical protein
LINSVELSAFILVLLPIGLRGQSILRNTGEGYYQNTARRLGLLKEVQYAAWLAFVLGAFAIVILLDTPQALTNGSNPETNWLYNIVTGGDEVLIRRAEMAKSTATQSTADARVKVSAALLGARATNPEFGSTLDELKGMTDAEWYLQSGFDEALRYSSMQFRLCPMSNFHGGWGGYGGELLWCPVDGTELGHIVDSFGVALAPTDTYRIAALAARYDANNVVRVMGFATNTLLDKTDSDNPRNPDPLAIYSANEPMDQKTLRMLVSVGWRYAAVRAATALPPDLALAVTDASEAVTSAEAAWTARDAIVEPIDYERYYLQFLGTSLLMLGVITALYVCFLELPFWWGQTRWKRHEMERTARMLGDALDGMRAQMGSPGIDGARETLQKQYQLARDSAQAAESIQTHTVSGVADIFQKGLAAVISAGVAAVFAHGHLPGL